MKHWLVSALAKDKNRVVKESTQVIWAETELDARRQGLKSLYDLFGLVVKKIEVRTLTDEEVKELGL